VLFILYRYDPWLVVINAYFSSDLVQFDQDGTTQNLGRIVPEVGADRPRLGRMWGGSTRGGSTLGRIACKPFITPTIGSSKQLKNCPTHSPFRHLLLPILALFASPHHFTPALSFTPELPT